MLKIKNNKKKVVITSSIAAITDSPDGSKLSEKDWNTESSLTRNPYYYSKKMCRRRSMEIYVSK